MRGQPTTLAPAEVETTVKALDQHLAILPRLRRPGVEPHWCAVPTVAQERLLQAVAVLDVHGLVRVWDWPVVAARCD